MADAATPAGPELADALDQAVIKTPLRARDPLWWTVVGISQTVLALLAVAGLLWLVALGVVGWLQLPEIGTPRVGPLPLPTLLLGGGLLLGLIVAGPPAGRHWWERADAPTSSASASGESVVDRRQCPDRGAGARGAVRHGEARRHLDAARR